MCASTSPFLTIWPSVNSTSVITPDTCGRKVMVVTGVTVPSASISTGISAFLATAMPTVTSDPPPGRPPPAASAAGRLTKYHAAPTRASNASTAITAPTQRRFGLLGESIATGGD